jgi:putative ABC transport system ATP-binding protein
MADHHGLVPLVSVTTIEATHLFRFFHSAASETFALRDVSLEVDGGDLVAITGPSGSGKSTLLNCLAGLDVPDGGTVRIEGLSISRLGEPERAAVRARSIGVVLQTANLLRSLTVREQLELAQRFGRRVDRVRARFLLDRLGIDQRADARPGELSGGELVRAALAVALANDPLVILADEPTGELDAATAAMTVSLLRQCADDGAAVLIVTHAQAVAHAADRELVLADGRLAP